MRFENKIISQKLNEYKFNVVFGDIIIGTIFFKNMKRFVNITRVWIDSAFRRQNIGSKMLTDTINLIKKKFPNKKIVLEANPYLNDISLDNLIIFYEKLGFETIKKYKIYARMQYKY